MTDGGKVILETERLRLREMTEADAPSVFLLNSNPKVVRYVAEPTLLTEGEALEVLRTKILPQYRAYGVGRWAICLAPTFGFIGWCGLKYLPETDAYDLGYRLMESHWGHGYAFEAAQAVVEWGQKQLPGRRIVAQAHEQNLASLRIFEKLGLRFDRTITACGGPTAVYVTAESSQRIALGEVVLSHLDCHLHPPSLGVGATACPTRPDKTRIARGELRAAGSVVRCFREMSKRVYSRSRRVYSVSKRVVSTSRRLVSTARSLCNRVRAAASDVLT